MHSDIVSGKKSWSDIWLNKKRKGWLPRSTGRMGRDGWRGRVWISIDSMPWNRRDRVEPAPTANQYVPRSWNSRRYEGHGGIPRPLHHHRRRRRRHDRHESGWWWWRVWDPRMPTRDAFAAAECELAPPPCQMLYVYSYGPRLYGSTQCTASRPFTLRFTRRIKSLSWLYF